MLLGTLILCVLVSGLLIIHQSKERRENYTQLAELRTQQDIELSEYSRLLLEKESLSSYPLVLKHAEANGFSHPEELHSVPTEQSENE